MRIKNGVEIFYGLDDIDSKLDKIISSLNIKQERFEIKLIMCEAITNAFIHGNDGDVNKPVYLCRELKEDLLIIEVADCGCGLKNVTIPKEIGEDNILQEGGRGLYLINCYADEVQFKANSIIIKKYIIRGE
jgi:serine/threonine-protein kinase RsbW